jgi:hypothetical protein
MNSTMPAADFSRRYLTSPVSRVLKLDSSNRSVIAPGHRRLPRAQSRPNANIGQV